MSELSQIGNEIDRDAFDDKDTSLAIAIPVGQAQIRHEFTFEEGQRLKRKVDWVLLPLLAAAYLIKNMASNMPSVSLDVLRYRPVCRSNQYIHRT